MIIRTATEDDWPAIWPFWRDIVEAGETYAYPLGAASETARGWWFDGSHVVVATEDATEDGRVLGSAKMGPNRPGRGAHVGTASFMVAPEARGRGVGSRMVAMAAAAIAGPIRAEIKPDNGASIRIAEAAGMQLDREDGGILHFRRDPLPHVR